MPTYLSETLYRFCTRDLYSHWQRNKAAYEWVSSHWVSRDETDEVVTKNSLQALLFYLEKRGHGPESIDALGNYVVHNLDNIQDFQQQSNAKYLDELEALKEYESHTDWDDDVIFAGLITEAREGWFCLGLHNAECISVGSRVVDKKTGESGTTAAIQWFRSYLTKDFNTEAPVVAGLLNENVATVLTTLEQKLSPTETTGKFPIGFSHIDECVTVGKQNLRFIGVLGMSGDGKTTLTNTIVYNWLTQGAHILYCSTEHSPTEIWEFMAFLHQTHPDYGFKLPAMQNWEGGTETGKVNREDQTNMYRILAEIQDRENLPGLLDCQQFRDWETIKSHLTINNKKNKYDILVVDYLGRLDVPGDPKFRDQAVKAMIHDAQKLTREFNDNRGLILLTPIQVNREGHKKALKAEEGESRYDINAVAIFSEYQHDLDLLLSIWSDDAMKLDSECEIQTLKKRKGRQPLNMRMRISPNSGAVEYTREYKAPVWVRTDEDMAVSTDDISNKDWRV